MYPNTEFEIIAHVFYKQTGYLRPGKSEPAGTYVTEEERQAAWDTWWRQNMVMCQDFIKAFDAFAPAEE